MRKNCIASANFASSPPNSARPNSETGYIISHGTMATPEYNHHIQRFVLRKFAHPYKGKSNRKKQIYPDDPVLNAVNMALDEPEFIVTSVKKTFGQIDMYKDDSLLSADQPNRVEEKMGQLKHAASEVLKESTDAVTHEPTISLTSNSRMQSTTHSESLCS